MVQIKDTLGRCPETSRFVLGRTPITDKRYRAHCGRDPGGGDDVGIYYFKWNGESFSKQVIDYGRPRVAAGCGISFALADLTANGLPDLIAPGKHGLYLFENLGQE